MIEMYASPITLNMIPCSDFNMAALIFSYFSQLSLKIIYFIFSHHYCYEINNIPYLSDS